MSDDAIPVLDLDDDPVERGVEHGRRFERSIRHNLEVYLARFEASGLSRETALAEGAEWDRRIAAAAPEYAAEMRGVSQGSGLPPGAIALLNARYEIAFTLFGREARAADGPASEPDGCTTVGLLPQATSNGHTILAQNWDWLAAIQGHCLVLRIRRTGKPSLICLTEAGIVGGKMGVNDCGIGLVENGLAGANDGAHPYEKPFHVRCREVLDAETLSDALLPVVQTQRTASANFMIGCAGGEIIDLETTPDLVTALHPREGILTHSNHFLDPRHGPSQMERLTPSTLFRAARLERLLRTNAGRLDVAAIREVLCDHLSYPHAICRHPDERLPPVRRTMTLASVIIDLDERAMWVAEGNPCTAGFVRLSLAPGAEDTSNGRVPLTMAAEAT